MMANKGVLSGFGGFPIPKPSTDDTDGAVSITLHLGEGQNQPKLNGCFISANEEFFKLTDADDKYRKVRKKSTFFIYFCFKEHLEEVKGEIRVHCSYRKGNDKYCETESDNILIPHDDGCHVFLPASQKELNTLRCKMFLYDISKKIPSRFHALKAGIHKGLQERGGLTVFVDIELELNGDNKLFVIRDKTFEKLVNGPLLSSNEVVGYYFKDQGDNKMTVYLLGREETKDVWKKSYINSPNRGEVLDGTQQGPYGISQVDSAYSIPSDFEISPLSHDNGNSNYIKLCNLLVVVGTKVLKDVFDSIHPPESLHEVLQSSLIHNLLKNLKSKRLLYNQQWNILYPTSGSVTSSNFDITLLFLLLRHICSLKAAVTGWYNQPKSTDFSLQADLVRIRYCRNELVHNPSVQALSESEMEKKFLEIEAALTRLSGNSYLREIQKLKSQAIVSENDNSVEAPMQAREAEVYRRNILDTMKRINRRLEQMATSSSPVQIKINCSFKQIAAGGTALIWAALSASILNHYRDEPDRMIDLFQNIIVPGAFATAAIVSALLQGSVEILVEVQSLAALKQLWKRCVNLKII